MEHVWHGSISRYNIYNIYIYIYIYIYSIYSSPRVMDWKSITQTNQAPGDRTRQLNQETETGPAAPRRHNWIAVVQVSLLQTWPVIGVYKCLTIQLASRPRSPPNPRCFWPVTPPHHNSSDPRTPLCCHSYNPPCWRSAIPHLSWLRSAAHPRYRGYDPPCLRIAGAPTLSHSTPLRLRSVMPPRCRRSGLVTQYKMP
jgi:hypothetical protein